MLLILMPNGIIAISLDENTLKKLHTPMRDHMQQGSDGPG